MKLEVYQINKKIMKKYYDCSINDLSEKLHIKSNLGTKENDIMRDLHKYSHLYGFERVFDYKDADIIITNTIYPDDILQWSKLNNIPLIKRMDGIYWQNDLLYKNELLNNAAKQSDYVIFISEYSKNMLNSLYGFLPINHTVILNNVDDNIFYNTNSKRQDNKFRWITSATNWDRKDKRLNEVIRFSEIINKNDEIYLIGKCDKDLPNNIIKIGYINDYNIINKLLNSSDAYLSLFFRDAGSKATCQAVQVELPILYTSSGGLKELVNNNGIIIDDYNKYDYLDNIPELSIDELKNKYILFKKIYFKNKSNYIKREIYQCTINSYFNILKKLLNSNN